VTSVVLSGFQKEGLVPRILIVEDDDRIRIALRLMFEGEGFVVDDAPTGEVGMALFNRMTADIAIVDIMLPGMTGFETCQRCAATSDLPIVIVSARDDTADVVLGLESGADDYVTKPFVPEELLARVRAHLRRSVPKRARQRSAGQPARDPR
jgi:two-component system response regulator MtrA